MIIRVENAKEPPTNKNPDVRTDSFTPSVLSFAVSFRGAAFTDALITHSSMPALSIGASIFAASGFSEACYNMGIRRAEDSASFMFCFVLPCKEAWKRSPIRHALFF